MSRYITRSLLFVFLISFLAGCAMQNALLSARSAFEAGNLEQAYERYSSILDKEPENKEAQTQIQAIGRTLSERAVADARASLQTADPVTVPQLESVIAKLTASAKYDLGQQTIGPALGKFQSQINTIRQENENRAKNARSAMSSNDFTTVKDQIELIRRTDPSSPVSQTLESEYKNSYSTFLEQKMNTFLKDENLPEARAAYESIVELGLPEIRMGDLTTKFKNEELEILKKQARSDMKKKKFYRAYLSILEGGREKDLKETIKEIRTEGSKFYLERAKKFFEKGEVSRAYLEAVKGLELNEKLSGMFEIHRDSRDKVMEKMQKYIAIPAFGAPTSSPDLGPQFADALISYLFRILPYGISIVEREKIDLLIEEQKREFQEVGNMLNVNLIISGNVSLMNIDRQKSESKAITRAQVGQKMVPNPEYEMMIQAYGNKIHKQKNLPPQLIAAPEFENFEYMKGKVTMKGFASVSCRIFDTRKGGIIYAQEFNANYEESDEYQDAVDVAGVKGDPLELPTDTEFAEKLRTKIIQQIADVIQAQFAEREKAFLEEAEYFLARKEEDKAMDPLAQGFLYSVKAKVDPKDPNLKKLRDLILEHTEKSEWF